MDIEYLLALQQIRLSSGSLVENVMLAFSFIGDGPALVALALIIYWCVSKRIGFVAMATLGVANFTSQLIKNIACVYRPWIRDARILPAEGALEGAGGYSFPSGHCTGTGATLGSIAWLARKGHKAVSALCVLVILVVAFSRNFLGVHTPQDVLVGLCIAVVFVAVVNAFANWIDRSDAMVVGHKRDLAAVVVVLVVCAASIAVVELKAYPMDFVNGQLVVDPEDMKKGSFEAVGLLAGLSLGWLCERRLVRFSTGPEVGAGERVLRGVVGVCIVGATYVATDIVFKALLPYLWAKLCAYLVLVFVAMFVVPALFGIVHRPFSKGDAKRGAHAA